MKDSPTPAFVPAVKARGWLEADGRRLLEPLWMAVGPGERTRGLLGCDGLAVGTGLLIPDCRLIHTFGMRFPLDLAFLGADGRVVRVRTAVPPGRMVWGGWRARHVVEMASGWLQPGQMRMGALCRWMVGR